MYRGSGGSGIFNFADAWMPVRLLLILVAGCLVAAIGWVVKQEADRWRRKRYKYRKLDDDLEM